MKNKIIGVTGVTGVGKDYLVTAANADNRVKTYNLGTLVGEALNMDRDTMMIAASPDEIRLAQFKAYRTTVTEQPAVVTCHAIRELKPGKLAFDIEMERIFNPLSYVFVRAPADLIKERIQRRNASGQRKSIELSERQIQEEQDEKLELTRSLTDYLCTRLLVLDNTDEAYVGNVAILRSEISILIGKKEESRDEKTA